MDDGEWRTAEPDDLRRSVAFVLKGMDVWPPARRGKARPFDAEALAERIVAHLEISNYRVLQGPPRRMDIKTGQPQIGG